MKHGSTGLPAVPEDFAAAVQGTVRPDIEPGEIADRAARRGLAALNREELLVYAWWRVHRPEYLAGLLADWRTLRADERRVAQDLRVHGQRAHHFYAAASPNTYAAAVALLPLDRGRMPRARSREHRPTASRRAGSSSSTSSSDPGEDGSDPEPAPRLCACGCGRDISHKRAGARTYNATCRQRIKRWGEAAVDVDAAIADARAEQGARWAEAAARERHGRLDLTEGLEADIRDLEQQRRVALSTEATPRRTEIDGLAWLRWAMETNGVYTGRRHRGSAWSPATDGGLRTRPVAAA